MIPTNALSISASNMLPSMQKMPPRTRQHPKGLTIPLFVSFYTSGLYSRHWAVYIEPPYDEDKTVMHATGMRGDLHVECRNSNARKSKSLLELMYLCQVPESQIEDIKDIAEGIPLKNEDPGWGCKNYVMDLLDALEDEGIIEEDDMEYKVRRQSLDGQLTKNLSWS